jgi:dTDP-4-dehydrorhamnose 3,5-epimerase
MQKINNVIITPLRKIPDERGCIMHMLRNDSPVYDKFGEIYFSVAYPGVIKGWHEHTLQVQNYCVVSGVIKLVLYDNRLNSSTYKNLMELFVGDHNYCLITIPTGVINGYKCIGTTSCMVANCSTLPYQEGEMIRYDPYGDKVPYRWPIEMK